MGGPAKKRMKRPFQAELLTAAGAYIPQYVEIGKQKQLEFGESLGRNTLRCLIWHKFLVPYTMFN
jgi:hypothetical protein